jgi:hypothetical protein
MDDTFYPYKFADPWAINASGSLVTSMIPVTTVTLGAASQSLGFPPETAAQPAAGGIPPAIWDFNGVLSYTTKWLQWWQAGGPNVYDATFSSAIGGYPYAATLYKASTQGWWLSLADNNTSDPDTGGANWLDLSRVTGAATGTAAPYLVSDAAIVNIGYTPVNKAGDTMTGALTTTALTTTGAINAGTSVTANGGRLRASVGAFGSGDVAAATLLGDFPWTAASTGALVLPNGFRAYWAYENLTTYTSGINTFFPGGVYFSAECFIVFANFYGNSPPNDGTTVAGNPNGASLSTVQIVINVHPGSAIPQTYGIVYLAIGQ